MGVSGEEEEGRLMDEMAAGGNDWGLNMSCKIYLDSKRVRNVLDIAISSLVPCRGCPSLNTI